MTSRGSHVLSVVLEQHAEEAAFLWLLRRRMTSAPHFTLDDLAQLDDRVEAHLDGLRGAGAAGWEVAQKVLTRADAGEVFAEAVLAFDGGGGAPVHDVLEAGSASPELARGVVSALGWLPYQHAAGHLRRLFTDPSPARRRVALAAAAIHRRHPGDSLRDALHDGDPLLRGRALRAVGELGVMDSFPLLRRNAEAGEEVCRFWAAWSMARLAADRDAVAVLQVLAEHEGPFREPALQLAVRRLSGPAARQWQGKLAAQENSLRAAVAAAGALGRPDLVPWLLEVMEAPSLARVAGEAFTLITGVDFTREHLDGQRPEGFESGPTEDPEDGDVKMDPDEFLPWPDLPRVRSWWEKSRERFSPAVRYLVGRPVSQESLQEVLRTGCQRQRAAAALELALLNPGTPLFEVRAPGFRQTQLLGLC